MNNKNLKNTKYSTFTQERALNNKSFECSTSSNKRTASIYTLPASRTVSTKVNKPSTNFTNSTSEFDTLPDKTSIVPKVGSKDSTSYDISSSSGGRDHINKSTRAYRIRRSAFRILTKYKDIPADLLTEKDKASIKWAEQNTDFRFPNSSLYDPNKRPQQSEESLNNDDDTKRLKLTATTSSIRHSSNIEHFLTWAIVDFSNPDGAISPNNWSNVEIALMKYYKKVLEENPGPPPSCRDAGWYQNQIKLIACSDQRSTDLYKMAIAKLGEIWPGANLKMVTKEEIPNRPKLKGSFPAEPSKAKDMLELIKTCNPNFPTKDWQVLEVSEVNNHLREVVILVNADALAQLASIDYTLNYGFGSVYLSVYENDQAIPEALVESVTQQSATINVKLEASDDHILVPQSAEPDYEVNDNTQTTTLSTKAVDESRNILILNEGDLEGDFLSGQEDSKLNIFNEQLNDEANLD